MTSQAETSQLIEVLDFMSDPQPPVRRIALANLLPYTAADSKHRNLFTRAHYLEQIATMCADQEIIAHDALSALINLTSSVEVATRLSKIDGFVTGLVRMIIDEKALLSDLACMLLSNLTKLETVSHELLKLKFPFAKEDGTGDEDVLALDLMLEVFLKGEGKKFNPNANYDFLASVFADVSTIPPGRLYLLANSDPTAEPPLVKLISFTEHPSTIRRGGVASCIKNSAFNKSSHRRLVAPTNDAPAEAGRIDLLPQMLLPLCGPEEFDIDILDELPQDLQLLPPDKKREPDAAIRTILVETLILLATTRACRDAMRTRQVYQVIKLAHLAETVPKCTEPMVQLVNLLMREEAPETAIEEIDEGETAGEEPSTGGNAFVSAEGKTVEAWKPSVIPQPRTAQPAARPVPQEDSEDEEEMLLEV